MQMLKINIGKRGSLGWFFYQCAFYLIVSKKSKINQRKRFKLAKLKIKHTS
mgnify:CR=1 FL=1